MGKQITEKAVLHPHFSPDHLSRKERNRRGENERRRDPTLSDLYLRFCLDYSS
jgi:hypothetical protein